MSQSNLAIINAFSNMSTTFSNRNVIQTNSSSSFTQTLSDAKESSGMNRSSALDAKKSEHVDRQKAKDSSVKNDSISTSAHNENNEKDSTKVKELEDANSNNDKMKEEVSKKSSIASKENENLSISDVVNVGEQVEEVVNESKMDATLNTQILALVSQVLQMPIETIQEQLNDLGLQASDLLTEEGFSQFISSTLGQGSMEHLLGNSNIDIKEITHLFQDLCQLKDQDQPYLQEPVSLLEPTTINEVAPVVLPIPEEVGEANVPTPLEGFLQEISPDSLNPRHDKSNQSQLQNDEFEGEMTQLAVDSSSQSEPIGLTVPIHNFTTTTFTQTYNTEFGTATQMVTTRQAVDGRAFIEQVDFKVLAQTKELNIALSPKELGHMNIKIIENNGVMLAEIKVENDKAKTFILNEIQTLKDSLNEQGLNVADVKVDIHQEDRHEQMEQGRQKSSKRIQEIISKQLMQEEVNEDEVLSVSNESEVDYMV